MKTFRNPISPFSAPDPFMTYDPVTGFYYSLFTRGRVLELFRSHHAAEICAGGESIVIYEPNGERDGIWGDIWAPEMHKAPNGKWYIYTSGRKDEQPSAKRLFIMEALTDDPFGAWRFKCKPTPDVFSIDPTVYTAANGQQFICYSRVERGQVLDICALENPWTFSGKRAMISRAKYEWEMIPPYVGDGTINEGPFSWKTASGCSSSTPVTDAGRTTTPSVFWNMWAATKAIRTKCATPRTGSSTKSPFSPPATASSVPVMPRSSDLRTARSSGARITA